MSDSKKRYQNKSKYHYTQAQKKSKAAYLTTGMKGFLCTCNFQEKNCVREAYNLLNEYADKLYGPDEKQQDDTQTAANEMQEDEIEDVSDNLEKQIAEIKSSGHKFNRFQSVMTSVPNFIFIKTNIEDTIKLGHSIVEDISNTRVQKTRYLLRLVPIEATCSTKMDDVVSTAGKLFDKYFLGEPTTFSIICNRHYNNSFSKDIAIKELAELVVSKNCLHKVNLTKPRYSIIVEVVKAVCLLGVVPDYCELKKYNLFELCVKPDEKEKIVEQTDEISNKPLNKAEACE